MVDDKTDASELIGRLDAALAASPVGKGLAETGYLDVVLEAAAGLLSTPGGIDALLARVPALEARSLFAGTDWDRPAVLVPAVGARTLRHGDITATVVEALSELRMLAIVRGEYDHPGVSAEHAEHFLTQVLARNLDLVTGGLSEAERNRPGGLGVGVQTLCRYLLDQLGYEDLISHLAVEVRRILGQGPIQVDNVKHMITQIAVCGGAAAPGEEGVADDASVLVAALFGPTPGCREDPGLEVYRERLTQMDEAGLLQEASAFAGAMHDTGLVSPYMPVLLRYLRTRWNALIPTALGLSATGDVALKCYFELMHTLIDEAVTPETSQAVWGLTTLLERGVLFMPALAPSLWRQIRLPLCEAAETRLATVLGTERPARVYLLAGVLTLLGRPLGVGQGSAPTCQSARALSMWAYNEPDRLLQMVAGAARDNEIQMRFEGETISSRNTGEALAAPPVDVDPVSMVTVPHLDRVYIEMGRRSAGRGEDPHKWVNPEFHGNRVAQGFRIVVDVNTGHLQDHEGFVRAFYAAYHPYYNGNLPVIQPQPAGIAATDSIGRFLGWHAITIQRLMLGPDGEMRVYMFNPNNDSGQDWGQGIVTATHGHGELPGESSLLVPEFASRLYVFHYDPLEVGDPAQVPDAEVNRAMTLARESWAAGR